MKTFSMPLQSSWTCYKYLSKQKSEMTRKRERSILPSSVAIDEIIKRRSKAYWAPTPYILGLIPGYGRAFCLQNL